jgi:hypothetical protein
MATEETSVVPVPESTSIPDITTALAALKAVKNIRAVVLTGLVLITSAIVFGLVMYLGGRLGSQLLMFIGMIVAWLIAIYGISAVGFMLMSEAKGTPPLSIIDAVMASLASTHRWIVVMLCALVVFIAFALVLLLVLFVCKIPFVGPVLYTGVLPVATFATALFLAAMYFVVSPLSFPAVWTGDTAMQAISKLSAIFRQRLIPVVVQVLLLLLVCFFVASIIGSLVFSAFAIVMAISAGVLPGVGGGIGMGSMAGLMRGGSGYLIAGSIGGSIVVAVVLIVPFLILLQGYCLIYLNIIKGMDFSAAEAQLKSQMESVQRKAREAQERVREKAQSMKRQAPAAEPQSPADPAADAPPASAAPSAALLTPAAPSSAAQVDAAKCSKCDAPISTDDVFCGNCGNKLRA